MSSKNNVTFLFAVHITTTAYAKNKIHIGILTEKLMNLSVYSNLKLNFNCHQMNTVSMNYTFILELDFIGPGKPIVLHRN